MADLVSEFPKALEGAATLGNFMLKVDEQRFSPATFVDRALLDLLSCASSIEWPGYSCSWHHGARMVPGWASELDRRIALKDGAYAMTPADATAAELREYWVVGSFFGERFAANAPREQYRPGLPLVVLDPALLGSQTVARSLSGFVGFAADLKKRGAHYRSAVVRASRLVEADRNKLVLLYQDASWLMFIGSNEAMALGLASARDAIQLFRPN